MSRENDFPLLVKRKLAERAGFKCSYLSCGQATIGPSREKGNTAVSNTGVAAHIYSASSNKGARRIPSPNLSHEKLINIDNGIWMCQTHGKYIDDDEDTFTINELKKWKEIAEEVARKMQASRCNYIQALAEIEHTDPKVTEMVTHAQQYDPSNDRYDNVDLLLYKKILKSTKSFRLVARKGNFIYMHSATLRKSMEDYLFNSEVNPVEFSFFDKNIQKFKEKMDLALYRLINELNNSTFYYPYKNRSYYRMSPDWKNSPRGLKHYIKTEDRIIRLSTEFTKQFDKFHNHCHAKFLE